MHFPGFDGFHILGALVWGFASLVALLVVLALVALLVRYLIIATRAHQLYIANNTPSTPAASAEPVVAPKRTPKTPPAV